MNTPAFNAYAPSSNKKKIAFGNADERMTSMELDSLLLNPNVEDITKAPPKGALQNREALNIKST